MSFFSDLFEGNFGNLGTDLSHSFSSFGKHPSEMWETAAAAAAALTGGAALGFLPGLGGLGAAGAGALDFGGLFGGGAGAADALAPLGYSAAGDAVDTGGLFSGMFGDMASTSGQGGLGAIDTAFGSGAGLGGDIAPIASGTSVGATDIGAGIGSTAGTLGGAGAGASPGLLSQAGTWAMEHPLAAGSLALGAGNIAKQALFPPSIPNQAQLTGIANQAGVEASHLQGEAQQFLQPSLTGKLPPQLEAQVKQATQDAINTDKARYASMGLGNSTMSADQQAYIELQAQAMRGQLAQQLAQTGMGLMQQATADMNIESQIYSELMKVQMQEDASLEQSISGFASSLAYASVVGQRKGP